MPKTVPIENYLQKALLSVPPVVIFFASLCLAMRLWGRKQKSQKLFAHDYLCAASLFFSIALYTNTVLCVRYGGLGMDAKKLHPSTITFGFHTLAAQSVLYGTAVALIQLSILALYIQIFGLVKWHKYTCYVAICLVIGWWISYFVTTFLSCVPFDKFWTPKLPGHCINEEAFARGYGLSHTLLDFFILTFCLPIIWRLKTSLKNKLSISIACTLGIFATICGFLKMNYYVNLVHYDPSDFTQSAWLNIVFQHLEVNCAIICSCMTMFPFFLRHLGTTSFGTSSKTLMSSIYNRFKRLVTSRGTQLTDDSELAGISLPDKIDSDSHKWLSTGPKNASNSGAYGSQTFLAQAEHQEGKTSGANSASSISAVTDPANVKVTKSWNVAAGM